MNHTITDLRPKNRSQIAKQVFVDCIYLSGAFFSVAIILVGIIVLVALGQAIYQ